nr:hypothetical protein [Tanacetum cinerariifolium]
MFYTFCSFVITYIPGSSGLRRFFRYAMFIIYSTYVMYGHYIRSLSVMLSRISFHVLIRQRGVTIIIFEATIRRDLKFEDEGGVDCLSNEIIFEQLPLMGVIDLENTKTVQAQEISSLKKRVKRLEKKKRSRTHGLKRLYTIGLSTRVESSTKEQSLGEEDASKQERNIADIDVDAETTFGDETAKDQGRYDDQEMFDTSVLDYEEEVLLKEAQDVQNVVEKVIEDITTAGIEEIASTTTLITAVDVTPDELTMAQALVEIKKSKPKGAITTTTTVTIPTPDSTSPKARRVVMQEPSETPTTTTIPKSSKVQDKGKGITVEEPLKMKNKYQISFDEQEARRLQTELDEHDKLAEAKDQLIEDENLA